MNAARLDLGGLRIFVLVDHVLVDAFVHKVVDFRLRPGLAECRKVLPGIAVEHQLVVDDRIGVPWIMLALGKLILRHAH